LEEVKSCIQGRDETLCSYVQRWSVIKNSTEDVFDEKAIDAFSAGLRRSDLVEEIGRVKPRIVSELMEIANRLPTEKTCITTKGDVHRKSTNPTGKGDGTATATTMEGEIR
jgi:hypothetical protein